MISATLPNHVRFNHNNQFQNFYELFKPSVQDKKFIRILFVLLILYFVVGVVVPFMTQIEVKREVKEQLPVHLAKIVLQEKKLPPTEKVVPEKVIPEEKKPIEVKKEKFKNKRELAKKKAKSSGLSAMKDELLSMRDAFVITPNISKPLSEKKSTETRIKRKLLAAQVNKQSNSLSAQNISQTVISDELSTRNTQQIRLSEEEILAGTDVIVEDKLANANSGQRSEMTLRRTLEVHKSRLYARYNRALRKDPFLQGRVLFEIEIQPSGKVSLVTVKSSELNNNKLERQLMAILRSIQFPEEDVAVMVTVWEIDFLPS